MTVYRRDGSRMVRVSLPALLCLLTMWWIAGSTRAGERGAGSSAFPFGLRASAPFAEMPMAGYLRVSTARVPDLADLALDDPFTQLGVAHSPGRFAEPSVFAEPSAKGLQLVAPTDPLSALGLGADGTYDLGSGFGLGLDTGDDDDSEPMRYLPDAGSLAARLGYDLLPTSSVRATLFVNGGARWVTSADAETFANRIEARGGAFVGCGFKLSF